MAYNTVTVTTSATLIVSPNTDRLNLILTNFGSTVCYIGQDASVTSSNGVHLNQNDVLTEDNTGTKGYCGPIYAITATGSTDIRYWERTSQR
jgi:hypothetical protein